MNVQNIEKYINQVCTEAVRAENRPDDVKYQFCVIKNYVIFSVKSQYDRVRTKILYRLTKNFNKNFPDAELRLIPSCILDLRLMAWNEPFDHTKGFDVYPLKSGLDPNHTVAYWNFFGKDCCLCAYRDNDLISVDAGKKGKTVVNKHFENFIDLTGDRSYGVNTHSWEKYKSDYKKIYGCDPYEIGITYKNF